MFYRSYKAGMQAHEQEVIRQLRRRGYAIALFPPQEVGDPLNRGTVEGAMVKAGKQSLKQKAKVEK